MIVSETLRMIVAAHDGAEYGFAPAVDTWRLAGQGGLG